MKNFWKVLGLAALAAAVPVRYKKDEDTGKKTFQSLLLSVDVDADGDSKVSNVSVNIGDGVINSAISGLVTAKKEADLFTDDPAEAVVAEAIAGEAPAGADEIPAGVSPEEEASVPVIEDLENEV